MHLLKLPPLCLALLWLALAPFAPSRTLTSAEGRTIEVEVLGFEGLEKVVIKRADTGQTFTLAISTFSETDQQALRAEAKAEASKPPPPPRPGDLAIELTRKSTDTERQSRNVTVRTYIINGRVNAETGTVRTVEAQASYTVTIVNRTKNAFDNLRVEYAIFSDPNSSDPKRGRYLYQKKGEELIATLPAYSRASVSTASLLTRKTTLRGAATWSNADPEPMIDLEGIWVRVYQGKMLVLESATPTTLATEYDWGKMEEAASSAWSTGRKNDAALARPSKHRHRHFCCDRHPGPRVKLSRAG